MTTEPIRSHSSRPGRGASRGSRVLRQPVVGSHSLVLRVADRADVLLMPRAERGEVAFGGVCVRLRDWHVGPAPHRLMLASRLALHTLSHGVLQRVSHLLSWHSFWQFCHGAFPLLTRKPRVAGVTLLGYRLVAGRMLRVIRRAVRYRVAERPRVAHAVVVALRVPENAADRGRDKLRSLAPVEP